MHPSRAREDSPQHAILAKPWSYAIVGLSFHCDPADHSASSLELALRKQNELVRLRFTGVHELEVEANFPWATSGLQILDTSARGMEQARVRVCSFEQDSPIRFWARNVELVGAYGSTKPLTLNESDEDRARERRVEISLEDASSG